MTCDEFEQFLLDSSHCRSGGDGWLVKASKAAVIQVHVENCPVCAKKMAEATRLQDALEQLRASTMHLQAPAAVERSLLDAFRQQAARRETSVGRRSVWRFVWLWAAAALVLLAAGLRLYSSFSTEFPLKSENNSKGSKLEIQSSPSPDLSGAAKEAFNKNPGASAENAATVSSRRVAQADKPIARGMARNASIPPSDELSLNGGGSVVRVTLPFSSLTAMGLPVRPDLSDTRVTADVWMDPFGAVVGIRLVPAGASAD
jgi:hypothetical protein